LAIKSDVAARAKPDQELSFTAQGIAGLVPRKRGPRGAHNVNDAVMAFLTAQRAADPALTVRALLRRIHDRVELDVHRRSLERAVRRQEKNRGEGGVGLRGWGHVDGHAGGELRRPAAGGAWSQWPRRRTESRVHGSAAPRHGRARRVSEVTAGQRLVAYLADEKLKNARGAA
jgi:hypothetical protein